MNTTNSQAASIYTYEFQQLAANYGMAWTGTKESEQRHLKALVAHIDAKLAQAREEGFEEGLKAPDTAYLVIAERAKKAESRLAEIQRGVHGLDRYGFDGKFGGDFGGDPLGPFVKIDEVRALLQPPSQSDTNGLPG